MTVDNIDIVILTCQFVLPGYIVREVLSSVLPQKQISEGAHILETIGYSILNFTLWCWLFQIIHIHVECRPVLYLLTITASVIVTSCLTGIAIGIIKTKQIFRVMLQKIGINLTHPIPIAWDYKFSENKSYWVEVTVSNGKTLRGLYSSGSFVASDPTFRDLYIEELYLKENDTWTRQAQTAGVWINPEEIRYIKFYELEDTQDEQWQS